MNLKNLVLNIIGGIIAGMGLIPFLVIAVLTIAVIVTTGSFPADIGWLIVAEVVFLTITMIGYNIMPWYRDMAKKGNVTAKEKGARWAQALIRKVDKDYDRE